MKVAVSIPDPLFNEVERVSRRLGVPRSQLYARALQVLVRTESGDDVTERMNAALAKVGRSVDSGWGNLGLEVHRREKW